MWDLLRRLEIVCIPHGAVLGVEVGMEYGDVPDFSANLVEVEEG